MIGAGIRVAIVGEGRGIVNISGLVAYCVFPAYISHP